MNSVKALLLLAVLGVNARIPVQAHPPGDELRRTVLALYNSRDESEIRLTRIHRAVEMPLNHMGVVVRYRDINSGLPTMREMEPYLGVVTWFLSDAMPDPPGFVEWAGRVVDSGRKFVVMGDLGLNRDYKGRPTALTTINHFLAKLGLRNEWSWTRITYDARFVYKDPAMVEFERPLTGVLPPFDVIKKIDPRVRSFLVLRRGNVSGTESNLVVVGPTGGYVAEGYTIYKGPETRRMQLYLNPWEFFRQAFELDTLPKPDATTLSGRRIYYSHLDGDGWRNLSEIGEFKKAGDLAATVILEKVIRAYPDLPFTIAPIAADIDPGWHGSARSMAVARAIFAEPNTEAGSHTYSHPLNWEFFVNGDTGAEARLLRRSMFRLSSSEVVGEGNMHGHELPRSYAEFPFQLEREVAGSVAFINRLLPKGKRVETYQWSGDTLPFAAAVEAASASGLQNINGGDTRFDQEYPSYAWVAPIGRQVGNRWQVYASNSNENTYTDMWTDRYFGFKELVRTLTNTEQPRRIKPFNVYFHMYSGQKLASLNALLMNLNMARSSELAPVTTGNYASIAQGFYSARIFRVGERAWRIEDRGELQTIRFDSAAGQSVDFAASRGVIGERSHQGSLYVALDAAEASPVIALRAADSSPTGANPWPYLVHSRWKVRDVRPGAARLTCEASGFGRGDMVWKVPAPGRYRILVSTGSGPATALEATAGPDRTLTFSVAPAGRAVVRLTIASDGAGR